MPEYGINSRIENDTEMTLEKILVSPIDQVYKMFSDTKYLEHFWAPLGWELIYSTLEFEPEGEWFYGMRNTVRNPNEETVEKWGLSVFKVLEEPHVIETVDFITDEKGEINRELPASKTRIEFKELDDEHTIMVGHKVFNSAEELEELIRQGLKEEIAERWDRLSQYLTENEA